ncbi:MAG: hypothetical protein V3R16_03960, partial [Nitrospirales bacterium]
MQPPLSSDLLKVLQRQGNLEFLSNRASLSDVDGGSVSAVRQATGHLIFYGSHGRRILATDPDGNPLHECEWSSDPNGRVHLAHARMLLDWGQWVGLKPSGMVQTTNIDLSTKPGWERLQADDLRRMAAQAMKVPFEEIRFFYSDEDLAISPEGHATIRHRKDAFYVLDDGTFEKARFMACMGAMHWERIDFLPVVELFQSLLPGTGSAVFELIRGLYDDQNRESQRPLRYRGIPTYPSEAAFRLFSTVFSPTGENPLALFMEPARSHEVTWLPDPHPPHRYFDTEHKICVTVKGRTVRKATLAGDSSGLSFTSPPPAGAAPCGRWVTVANGALELHDGEKRTTLTLREIWGQLQDSRPTQPRLYDPHWRSLLGESFPGVSAQKAFSAVLLYPEDGTVIEERASQPFAADDLQDACEQDEQLRACVARAGRVLVDNFDAALNACVSLDRPRHYTILYRSPELIQKYVQNLWNQLARSNRLEWGKSFEVRPAEAYQEKA